MGFKLSRNVDTNMVWIHLGNRNTLNIASELAKVGIKVFADRSSSEWRLVFHHQISEEAVSLFLEVLSKF